MPRRTFIAGNWKMYKGPADADALAMALRRTLVDAVAVDVAVAPPFVSIPVVAARLKHSGVHVAAQDVHPAAEGAFTGAVSAEMLKQAGCAYAIVGHSERRTLWAEDDALINQKVHATLRSGLLPILCVGETLAERDAGAEQAVVTRQLELGLRGVPADQVASVTVAYEPVWAIGTGRSASPEQAQAVHAMIRAWLLASYPPFVGATLRIQYGGSVKPGNAAALLSQPDIDGALVGGASLDADDFFAIIRAATKGAPAAP